jgi:hypothetical protein
MYKRESVEKNKNLGNKIDGNLASLFQVFETRYNQHNQYDNFSVINNRIPSKQYYVSVVPDYVTVMYSVSIFTNYVEQNNKIIEAIEFAADSYWGDENRWHFRTTLDSFATTNIINTGEDRAAVTTVTLKVNGYLIADSINKTLADSYMHFSTAQVIFGIETIDSKGIITNMDYITLANKPSPTNATNATSFIGGGINVTNNTISSAASGDLIYLNTNKQLTADIVTTSTATFTGASLLQPSADSTLPATTINNFIFYRNGQHIPTSYVSISSLSGGIIFTFDVTSLGYNLESTDLIETIGKFS